MEEHSESATRRALSSPSRRSQAVANPKFNEEKSEAYSIKGSLKEIVGRVIGLSLCHGLKRVDPRCYPLFLFKRKFYRIFSDFEVRLCSGRSDSLTGRCSQQPERAWQRLSIHCSSVKSSSCSGLFTKSQSRPNVRQNSRK